MRIARPPDGWALTGGDPWRVRHASPLLCRGLARPHTKGEAEDVGVDSLLRSSAAQISEAELAQFGLYRPFDPADDPNNTEVNHIQLIPKAGPLTLAQATNTFNPDPSCR